MSQFKRCTTFLLILSLIRSSCAWADGGPIPFIDEELRLAHVTQSPSGFGVIQSKTFKDGATHAVLERLDTPEEGGLFLPAHKESSTTYVRSHDEQPSQLEGRIGADTEVPVVFSNPGGFHLRKTTFDGMRELSLYAGHAQQTSRGMAAAIDGGYIEMVDTLFAETDSVRALSMAASRAFLGNSYVSPSDKLSMTLGKQLHGIDPHLERWIQPDNSNRGGVNSHPETALEIGKSSILKSHEIFIESLDEGAEIHSKGFLHSTGGDIVIHARGDVFIDHLFAAGNLKVITTGRVYFGKDVFVGGKAWITASEIRVNNWVSEGELFLEASGFLYVDGSMKVSGKSSFVGHSGATFTNDVLLGGKSNVVSSGIVYTNGSFKCLKGSHFTVNGFINEGTFSSLGKGLRGKFKSVRNRGKFDFSLLRSSVELWNNDEGAVVRTNATFELQGETYINKGTTLTEGLHRVDLDGKYQDEGTFCSPTLFFLKAKGALFGSRHVSHVRDVLLSTSKSVRVARKNDKEKASFHFYGPDFFLDIEGEDVTFQGDVFHDSGLQYFTYLNNFYYHFNELAPDFSVRRQHLENLSLPKWKRKKEKIARLNGSNTRSQISFRAKKNLDCTDAKINPANGNVSLVAGENVNTTRAKVSSGAFVGNHLEARGKRVFIDYSSLQSQSGTARVSAQETAQVRDSELTGGEGTSISSEGSAKLQDSKLKSPSNSVKAKDVKIVRSVTEGPASVQGEKVTVQDMTSDDLSVSAKEVLLEGDLKAASLKIETDDLIHHAQVDAHNIHLRAARSYHDSADSTNNAHNNLVLKAPNGFEGQQKAGGEAIFKLEGMDFFKMLKLTDSMNIRADLGTLHLFFGEDFLLKPNLELYIGNLTNKGTLTTFGDLMVVMRNKGQSNDLGNMIIGGQGEFYSASDLEAKNITAAKLLKLSSDETITLKGMLEADSIDARARAFLAERVVNRHEVLGGHIEELGPEVGMRARSRDLTVEAREWFRTRGALFKAFEGSIYASAPQFYAGSQITTSDVRHEGKRSQSSRRTLTHHRVVFDGKKGVTLVAISPADSRTTPHMVVEGGEFRSEGSVYQHSDGLLEGRAVNNDEEVQTHTKRKGGIFRSKKEKTTHSFHESLLPNLYRAGKGVSLTAHADNHQWVLDVISGGLTRIISESGTVFMHGGRSIDHEDCQKRGSNLVWQYQSRKGHHDEIVHVSQIIAEGTEIRGAQGVHVDVAGENVTDAVEAHLKLKQTQWMKDLVGDQGIHWNPLAEEHDSWSESSSGLAPGVSALIALGVSCLTAGAGGTLIAPVIEAIGIKSATAIAALSASANATITSLSSRAAVSFISNKGDIGAVYKELSSSDALRSLAKTVLVAGSCAGLCGALDITTAGATTTQSLSDRIEEAVVRTGVDTVSSLAFGEENLDKTFVQALRSGVANVAGGHFAHKVGIEYKSPDSSLNYVTHKILHAAIGAGIGALRDNDALSGAIGATVGEIVGEAYKDINEDELNHATGERLDGLVQDGVDLAQMTAATVAWVTGQDVDVAANTAQNAVKENAFFILAAAPEIVVGASTAVGLLITYYSSSDLQKKFKSAADYIYQCVAEGAESLGPKVNATPPAPTLDTKFVTFEDPSLRLFSPESFPLGQPPHVEIPGFQLPNSKVSVLNRDHQYVKAPDTLPAFPDAKSVKKKNSRQRGGGLRERWEDKKYIYEWDSRHGTVEKHYRKGKKSHIGEFDPKTGKQLKPRNSKYDLKE